MSRARVDAASSESSSRPEKRLSRWSRSSVRMSSVATSESTDPAGVKVEEVVDNSPASKAGLQVDDVITKPWSYQDGHFAVPEGPGLGVKLDREKLREYNELYRRLGGYPYDQDPGRPGWTPIIPNDRWADPRDDRTPGMWWQT